MTEFEKRGGGLGVEKRAEGDKRTLVGYAAVFNSDTTIGDYFVERIAPGAFAKAIRGDVLALVSHDIGRVIGRTKSGTLRLSEDERGLKVEIDVPDTMDGRDLWTLVERGDISGMSFAFRATKQEWDDSGDMPKRTVLEAELYEVTATAIPAYPDTSLALRSLETARQERGAVDAAETERRIANASAAARRVAARRAAMEQKFRGLRRSADDYNATDVSFFRKMIGHHKDALKMADEYVDDGENPEVLKLAKGILKTQKAEIEQMKKWLKDRGLSEGSDDAM